jgi:hypothetical protein
VDNRLDERRGDPHDGRPGEASGMTAFIELVCGAHNDPDPVGPLVTLVDGTWAYCVGHGHDAHDWSRIAPTRREDLAALTQLQERRAS